jgi:putative ABC transport system ATP-binding protein
VVTGAEHGVEHGVEHEPSTAPPPPLVDLMGVTRVYQRGRVPVHALRGVDLQVHPGEIVALMGPSGCGKTTLLHIVGGLDRADAGIVMVAGTDLRLASQAELDRFRRQHVGMVLQSENLLSAATARDQVALGLLARGRGWRDARREALPLLEAVGLADRVGHRPDELSGGEQQRVALARALSGDARLILADEPTGELDSATAQGVLEVMVERNRTLGTTFLVATHDHQVMDYATRVVRLHDGRVEE